MMPDLEEVLEAFPDKELLIHIKDGNIETADVLLSYLSQMNEERRFISICHFRLYRIYS